MIVAQIKRTDLRIRAEILFKKCGVGMTLSPNEALHPVSERPLVIAACAMRGLNGAAIGFRAILADLEFALNVSDGDPESDDSGQHRAPVSLGQTAPLTHVRRLAGFDEIGEQSLLGPIVIHKLKCAACMDGNIVPGWNRKLLGIERRTD